MNTPITLNALSALSALIALGLFSFEWLRRGNITMAQTFAYATFAVNSMVYIFAFRSLRRSLLRSGSLGNNKPLIAAVALGLTLAIVAVALPGLRMVLGLAPLSLPQWGIIFGAGLALLVLVEVAKYVNARLHGLTSGPNAYR